MTEAEIQAAALQYIRKVSGFRKPSRSNADAFDAAVAEVTAVTRRLLDEINAHAPAARSKSPASARDGFTEKVTAFRPEMAVHGRYGQPCPECGAAIQRIVYAENEANYCPTCQTGGRLLADRALSRFLRADWPRTLDELEQRRANTRAACKANPS